MSELIYSRHRGEGLVVAEYAQDERTISGDLKAFDPSLRLVWEQDVRTGRPVWNVVSVWSPEHPAHQVLSWRDEVTLEPLPLTSRLVDEVKRLRSVDTLKQSDAANAALKAGIDKDNFADTLEVTSEFERLDRTGRVHVPLRTRRFGAGA